MLAGKNKRGWLDYTTTCTCRNEKGKVVKGRVDIPHKIRKWAKEHGDHRCDMRILIRRFVLHFFLLVTCVPVYAVSYVVVLRQTTLTCRVKRTQDWTRHGID